MRLETFLRDGAAQAIAVPDLHGDIALAQVQAAADGLEPIGLEALGAANLQDRIDRKFLAPLNALPAILRGVAADYRVLEVEGRRLCRYSTRYFDTEDLAFYHAHHAGRSPRCKVRVRRYLDSGQSFLEVKQKGGCGRTRKSRTLIADDPAWADEVTLPRLPDQLTESLQVDYVRVTLVSRTAAERITLDLMLTFRRDGEAVAFPDVVIVEVKQAGRSRSPFLAALRDLNLREGSLSKYCAGLATLAPQVKSNLFRPALRRLERAGQPIFQGAPQ